MMPTVTFAVPWVRGKKRPRGSAKNGIYRTYTPQETLDDQKEIADAFRVSSIRRYGEVVMAPRGEAVTVVVETWRQMPKSRPKSRASEQDTFKPDVDNIDKLVLDGLDGVAFEDDRQVTVLLAVKHPRTRRAGESTRVMVTWGDSE